MALSRDLAEVRHCIPFFEALLLRWKEEAPKSKTPWLGSEYAHGTLACMNHWDMVRGYRTRQLR